MRINDIFPGIEYTRRYTHSTILHWGYVSWILTKQTRCTNACFANFLYGVTIMQRCQFCGYELSDNTRFCGNCGRERFGTTLATSNPTFASSPDEFASTIATSP